jgi:hypothetical protein
MSITPESTRQTLTSLNFSAWRTEDSALLDILTGAHQSANTKTKNKLRGLSPHANYTDRATAACLGSYCQL